MLFVATSCRSFEFCSVAQKETCFPKLSGKIKFEIGNIVLG